MSTGIGLRAVVLAIAAVVAAWSLTVPAGLVTAAFGAFFGVVLGERAAASRLRLSSGLLGAGALGLLAVVLSRALVDAAWLARLVGPVLLLHVAEAALWASLALPAAFALRFAAARRPPLGLLEVIAVASAAATGFAAHRDGAVHRPLAVGDWAWSRNLDPALVFLVLGGLGTLLLAALMLRETRRSRLPVHFAVLVLVGALLVVFVRVEGLPEPDPASDLGLTGEPEEGDEGRERAQGGEGSGRSDQLGDLEFKDEYGQSGQQAPVAVVLLHDDYAPPAGAFYFRQSAFSQYNGRRLVQATRDDVDRDIVRRFPVEPLTVAEAPPTSDQRRALRTTIGLMVDHVRPFALDAPVLLQPTRNPNPMRFQRTFEVRSHVPVLDYPSMLGRRGGDPAWSDAVWRHYTAAPTDPRYAELAARLTTSLRAEYAADPLARALAVKSYLDDHGIYSRKSRHAGADDPAASFLFGDLTGYCVHFAHAATYLLRALDVPARVAAGYAVSESERGSASTILVRGANAHAWPEIHLEGVGWVVVDLTPATSLDEPTQAPDQRLQQMLGEMLRQGAGEDELRDPLHAPIDWAAWVRRLALLLALFAAVGWLVKLWRALAPRVGARTSAWRTAYRAALDRLAELGARRRAGESREAFARRVADLSPSFHRLTASHLAVALGSHRGADPAGILGALHGVGAELRQAVPWWRRLLGHLDPTSWLRAR
ncbi:MAG: transglutaminase-like domain-containing protein [Acidobacteriota bacterium]